jgi:hypothetical protein
MEGEHNCSNPTRASLVNLKLITIENLKSLKRHAFLETLLKKPNIESIYYKHVLSFNIVGFLLMMLLWWGENLPGKTVNFIKSADLMSEIRGTTILLSPSFYLCNVCRAIFGNKAELNRHILTHAGSAKGGGGGEGMYSERRVPRGSRWW